ncbi:MAG TPA: ACP S-malonyltransferase [Candidatus Binatia bacterium]|jgi:[acyl-carrier-protein] S-malonyltransferase
MAAKANVAFVFPGQGSQSVGMGKDLFDQFPAAKQVFQEADDALGFAISELCFSGPESELKLTQNTQPAILTTSIAALRVIETETALRPRWVAGHSLGEYSALVCAGALEFRDAVKIVRERGRMMQDAVPPDVGAMGVLLGLEMAAVRALCAEASNGEVVEPANYNGGGQIVIAGHKAAVARAMSLAKSRGVKKVLDIPVSAPFHCRLMAPAGEGLKNVLAAVAIKPFTAAVISNVEADVNSDPGRVKDLLVRQTVSPVRWEESVRKLEESGCERVFEVGPGKVLRGLIKRISPSLELDNFQSAADLTRIVEMQS